MCSVPDLVTSSGYLAVHGFGYDARRYFEMYLWCKDYFRVRNSYEVWGGKCDVSNTFICWCLVIQGHITFYGIDDVVNAPTVVRRVYDYDFEKN